MKLTLKLNLENFENQDFETNEYDKIEDCYREQITFLKGWLEFTPYARPILDHILRILGGEKSVESTRIRSFVDKDPSADSNPSFINTSSLAQREAQLEKTTVVETPIKSGGTINWVLDDKGVKYKQCKFCENLVSWNHDTNNYDHFNKAFKYLYPKCNTGG